MPNLAEMTQLRMQVCTYLLLIPFFFIVALRPSAGRGFLIPEVSKSHTTMTTDRNHATGEIRTSSPSKRAAADPRPRLRDHWDRHIIIISHDNLAIIQCCVHMGNYN